VNLASLQYGLEGCFVDSEIVPGRSLNILMPGQLLDEHNVGAVVEQAGTECVAEHMRGQALFDAGQPTKAFERR
jgi:hypothetical protein